MRTAFLLPLTAVVTVLAGCGSQGREQAAPSGRRDLTLAAPARQVDVASPVELQHLRLQRQTARPSSRTSRRSRPVEAKPAPTAVAATAVVLAAPAAVPASTPSEPANDRELLPGKTITVIPASSGPSTGSAWNDEPPSAEGGTFVVRRGGTCRPRPRPGIGIAGVPRPDFR